MKLSPTNPDLDIERIEKVSHRLGVIAHPHRIAIIDLLLEKEKLNVTDIHKHLGIGQALASHHLKLLKGCGVLASRRNGKQVIYSIKTKALKGIIDCVERCLSA